ncbi:M20/M25/M40 family metallo-hydrolase [Sphingomonas sp. S2-65]|uniref:M20/M25/M40 family metallo-hydrolase n=1 Tax=Sphingomonas sp. S2-65 TaxID=2903960 RepID=UPI001F450D3E|nr:M20/M25/M40 family metallo-hydrolase [Sphingomonas sp. S2-65]UYY57583.1 M20/M25/M40 family metallo-hydrolase [Sphingomonas sp. S2-65]
MTRLGVRVLPMAGCVAAALLAWALPVAAQQLPADQAALKAHVQFLAADSLRGREAGTRDFDIAADYVAAQMLAAGLKPAGADGGWFQPVRLATYRPAEKAKWTLIRGGATVPLQFGSDFLNEPVPAVPDFTTEGSMIFAGYGIVDAASGRDDYKGLDVRGRIVVIFAGVPAGLSNEIAAHFGNDDQKARLAQARGAKAVLVLESASRRADYAFEALVPYWDYERTGWVGPDGKTHMIAPGAPVVGYVSRVGAEKLFAGSRINWRDLVAAEERGARLPTGPLSGRLRAAAKTRTRMLESRNVAGMLEGGDPALKSQVVVLSAHLDHVGVGQAVDGDRIYNGAMDNAAGIATILEVARRFQAEGVRPRRSILFVALTAEEKGLIGSGYFANFPTVPKTALVADLNLDMPILTFPLQDLVVLGGERSSLGPLVAAAAEAEGLKVVADPSPEEMFFVRSDHYSFVQAGIPAVSVDTGPGGQGAAAQKLFLAEHYHQPSDQIGLPFDWASAAKFLRVNYAAARAIADADERPRWNKGDFFGTLFDGYGAN